MQLYSLVFMGMEAKWIIDAIIKFTIRLSAHSVDLVVYFLARFFKILCELSKIIMGTIYFLHIIRLKWKILSYASLIISDTFLYYCSYWHFKFLNLFCWKTSKFMLHLREQYVKSSIPLCRFNSCFGYSSSKLAFSSVLRYYKTNPQNHVILFSFQYAFLNNMHFIL